MKKSSKLEYVRRAIQVVCFILLPGLFINIYTSIKNIAMGLIHQTSGLYELVPDILLVLGAISTAALFGRFFCGWICSFGALQDWIFSVYGKAKRKKTRVPKSIDAVLKKVKYIVLTISVVFIWSLQIVAVPAGYNPLDAFGILSSLRGMSDIELLLSSFLPGTLLLLAILTASFFVERFFCRYLCPMGAIFSLVSRFRPASLKKEDDRCGACKMCTKECSMGINLCEVDEADSAECINCLRCVEACPRSNMSFNIGGKKIGYEVTLAVAVSLVLGTAYLSQFAADRVALKKSALKEDVGTEEVYSDTEDQGKYIDGTYEGKGEGFRGETVVQVTVENGNISGVEIVSTEDDMEFLERAEAGVISNIIGSQSVDVDAVSGATYSSEGLMKATEDALKNAMNGAADEEGADVSNEEAAKETVEEQIVNEKIELEDGVYEGTGSGYRGETRVKVTVSGGNIDDIEVISSGDDEEFLGRAEVGVTSDIIASQSIEVDAVSGATYSSKGIIEAVADALGLGYDRSTESGDTTSSGRKRIRGNRG